MIDTQHIDAGGCRVYRSGPFEASSLPAFGRIQKYDHVINLVGGQALLEWDGVAGRASARVMLPCKIPVTAGTPYWFTPLTDGTAVELWFGAMDNGFSPNTENIPWRSAAGHTDQPLIVDEKNIDLHSGGFIGGFYIRPMGPYASAKTPASGHKHYIDHAMKVVRGRVSLALKNVQGAAVPRVYEAGQTAHIGANDAHWITPLEDGTFWECWFSEAQAETQLGTVDVPWHDGKSDG